MTVVQVRERLAGMQEAMKRPEVQKQVAEMQSAMQNQQLQARMAELKARTLRCKLTQEAVAQVLALLSKFYMCLVLQSHGLPP